MMRRGWVLSLIVAAWGVVPAHADDPRPATWISSGALAYGELAGGGRWLERWDDPWLQALIKATPDIDQVARQDDFIRLRDAVQAVADELDVAPRQLLTDLTAGGLHVAVEVGLSTGPRLGVFVVPGDADQLKRATAAFIDLARKDAEAKGKPDPIRAGTHRDVATYAVAPSRSYAIVEGILIIASSDEALKLWIDRAKGKSPYKPLTEDPLYRSRRDESAGALAWAFARMDAVRLLNPKDLRFEYPEANPLGTLFVLPWVESFTKGPWAAAKLDWGAGEIALEVALAAPAGGRSELTRSLVPAAGAGASAPPDVPGLVGSIALRRELDPVWRARNDLFNAETLQGFAQLDTFAGTFFGGRDFESGVLGPLGSDWRLIVAERRVEAGAVEPDVKLPAFALIIGLEPGDVAYRQRLIVAFQSFVGLANLGAQQSPLMIGAETVGGVTVATANYVDAPPSGPVPTRFNFRPAAFCTPEHFALCSDVHLARDLVQILTAPNAPPTAGAETLIVKLDGAGVAGLLQKNRERLIQQNMLEEGNDRPGAERDVAFLIDLARGLGTLTLWGRDEAEATRLRLGAKLGPPLGDR